MAAAIGLLIETPPMVVGGTAEEFWTEDAYHPTDLDLCAPLTKGDAQHLRSAGFRREGRHWFHPDVPTVAIEFPHHAIDGDPTRAHDERIGSFVVKVIGLDDLYLDRLRQVTANPHRGSREYMSALAVMSARYEELDYEYIEQRLTEAAEREPKLVEEMRFLDRRINREARRRIAE